jgi:hypothetical protein
MSVSNQNLEIKLPSTTDMPSAWEKIKKMCSNLGISKKNRPVIEPVTTKDKEKKYFLIIPLEVQSKLCPVEVGNAIGLSGPAWQVS